MTSIAIFEFDALVAAEPGSPCVEGLRGVPPRVYDWLEEQCLKCAAEGGGVWLRLIQRRGHRAVQVTSFVGVIRAPDGYQIEVLPKVGRAIDGGVEGARQLLIEMLSSLRGFRHVRTDSAKISATRMPLLEVFIAEFLRAVDRVVKSGLRGDYNHRQGNLGFLRGKLLIAPHLRQNLCRADRFFTEYDEFTLDRPENRLIHSALRRVLTLSAFQINQQAAREFQFVFADVPASPDPRSDFHRVRRDRGMVHYDEALAWARLIIDEESPLTGAGGNRAPSLLFPMDAVFEAFVAKHLPRQLRRPLVLRTHSRTHHLVRHCDRPWFQLRPDLLVKEGRRDTIVLDTKWKLLDQMKSGGRDKYGLSQADFYQLHAYGQAYLDGKGDVVLIYPETAIFDQPLPVFYFPKTEGLRLWVLPFCLKTKRLRTAPSCGLSRLLET